jgi:transcriptional regulator with XRE-family HTH domain
MELIQIRLKRLRELVNRYESQKAFAEAVEQPPAYINHLLTGRRNMGEKTARAIEKKLKLPERWLDTPPDTEPQQPLQEIVYTRARLEAEQIIEQLDDDQLDLVIPYLEFIKEKKPDYKK